MSSEETRNLKTDGRKLGCRYEACIRNVPFSLIGSFYFYIHQDFFLTAAITPSSSLLHLRFFERGSMILFTSHTSRGFQSLKSLDLSNVLLYRWQQWKMWPINFSKADSTYSKLLFYIKLYIDIKKSLYEFNWLPIEHSCI